MNHRKTVAMISGNMANMADHQGKMNLVVDVEKCGVKCSLICD